MTVTEALEVFRLSTLPATRDELERWSRESPDRQSIPVQVFNAAQIRLSVHIARQNVDQLLREAAADAVPVSVCHQPFLASAGVPVFVTSSPSDAPITASSMRMIEILVNAELSLLRRNAPLKLEDHQLSTHSNRELTRSDVNFALSDQRNNEAMFAPPNSLPSGADICASVLPTTIPSTRRASRSHARRRGGSGWFKSGLAGFVAAPLRLMLVMGAAALTVFLSVPNVNGKSLNTIVNHSATNGSTNQIKIRTTFLNPLNFEQRQRTTAARALQGHPSPVTKAPSMQPSKRGASHRAQQSIRSTPPRAGAQLHQRQVTNSVAIPPRSPALHTVRPPAALSATTQEMTVQNPRIRATQPMRIGCVSLSNCSASKPESDAVMPRSTSNGVEVRPQAPLPPADQNPISTQPVASIVYRSASSPLLIHGLTRAQYGQQFLNRKRFEVWQARGEPLVYAAWNIVPTDIQLLESEAFRSATIAASTSALEREKR